MTDYGEPWSFEKTTVTDDHEDPGLDIYDAADQLVAFAASQHFRASRAEKQSEVEAMAERIVACVNACRGIPTSELEKVRIS